MRLRSVLTNAEDLLILERLRRRLSLEDSTGDQSLFGFYWTRKSVAQAAGLIDEFLPENGTVVDPFLGSGTNLWAFLTARRTGAFLGAEINEMPIANLRFCMEGVGSQEIDRIRAFYGELERAYGPLFEYPLIQTEQPLQLISATVDTEGQTPQPSAFDFMDGNGKRIVIHDGDEHFAAAREIYTRRNNAASKLRLPDLKLATNSRIAIKEGTKISDLSSPLVFSVLVALRDSSENRHDVRILLSSCLHLLKYTDKRSQSQFPYWYPKKGAIDRNPFPVFSRRLRDLEKWATKSSLNQRLIKSELGDVGLVRHEQSIHVERCSASQIPRDLLAPGKADLVITDPPYFDQVAYSEYLKLWEFFTGFDTNHEDEIVQSNRTDIDKSRNHYLTGIRESFRRLRDGSKSSSIALVFFKDSKLSNLDAFLRTVEEAGWRFVGQQHASKGQFSYKQNSSPTTTVEGDCIMVFRPIVDNQAFNLPTTITPSKEDCEALIRELVTDFLRKETRATISQIYDGAIVTALFQQGMLGMFTRVQDVLATFEDLVDFDPEHRTYRLKNEGI